MPRHSDLGSLRQLKVTALGQNGRLDPKSTAARSRPRTIFVSPAPKVKCLGVNTSRQTHMPKAKRQHSSHGCCSMLATFSSKLCISHTTFSAQHGATRVHMHQAPVPLTHPCLSHQRPYASDELPPRWRLRLILAAAWWGELAPGGNGDGGGEGRAPPLAMPCSGGGVCAPCCCLPNAADKGGWGKGQGGPPGDSPPPLPPIQKGCGVLVGEMDAMLAGGVAPARALRSLGAAAALRGALEGRMGDLLSCLGGVSGVSNTSPQRVTWGAGFGGMGGGACWGLANPGGRAEKETQPNESVGVLWPQANMYAFAYCCLCAVEGRSGTNWCTCQLHSRRVPKPQNWCHRLWHGSPGAPEAMKLLNVSSSDRPVRCTPFVHLRQVWRTPRASAGYPSEPQ